MTVSHARIPGTMLGTPCPNKSMLLDKDPRYERYGTGIFPFAGTRTGNGILLPVPSSLDCDFTPFCFQSVMLSQASARPCTVVNGWGW
jgi:hypothetical protein